MCSKKYLTTKQINRLIKTVENLENIDDAGVLLKIINNK